MSFDVLFALSGFAAAGFALGRLLPRKVVSPPQVVMAQITTRATGGTISVGHDGADVVIRMATAQKDASAEVRLGTEAAVRLSNLLIAYSNKVLEDQHDVSCECNKCHLG